MTGADEEPDDRGESPGHSPHWDNDMVSTLVDRLPELGLGMLLVRPGGRIEDADAGAVRITGRSVDELRALSDIAGLLAPEERHRRAEHRDRVRRGERTDRAFQTVVVRPDGSRREVDTVILPTTQDEFTTVVMRDSSEVAVRDQVIDWYRALVERMPMGVTILDTRGVTDPRQIRLWSANAMASSAAGRDLTPFVGEALLDVFPEARAFEEARRAFAMVGTDRTEYLPDLIVGDPDDPSAVYRRAVVALPEGALAVVLDDITRERMEDLRNRHLTERIVELADAERRQIAMGLHDDPLQQIAGASLLVSQQRRRDDHADAAQTERLAAIDAALRSAMEAMRQLVFELSPPELEESGLDSAIRRAADHLFDDTAVQVHVTCILPGEPPASAQGTAFRIAAEALTNIRKHASASRVDLQVHLDDRDLVIDVTDDGSGISGSAGLGHLGLRAMHDRAAAVGGSCTVTDLGPGTRVLARLPLDHVPTTRETKRGEALVRRPDLDSITASLRMERDSLRDAEAAASYAASEARRRLDAVTTLASVLRDSPADPAERARRAVAHLTDVVGDGASIRVVDATGTIIHKLASHHQRPEQDVWLDRYLLFDRPAEVGWAGAVLAADEPLVLEPDRVTWLPSLGEEPPPAPIPTRSALMAPMHAGGRAIGVLTVTRDLTPERFTTDDVGWICTMADLISGSMYA